MEASILNNYQQQPAKKQYPTIMQQLQEQKLTALLAAFIQSTVRPTSTLKLEELASIQINFLVKIKKIILFNPNNYHHEFYGRIDFPQLHQFVLEAVAKKYEHAMVNKFTFHVLALMTKFWVSNPDNFRKLYESILSLFQQRPYCGENCFKYLAQLVEVMQDDNQYGYQRQANANLNSKISQFSSIPAMRSSMETYFIYHMLNELLAFSNIFLDRSVVRNEQKSKKQQQRQIRSSEQNSMTANNSQKQRLKQRQMRSSEASQQSIQQSQAQLYTIAQPQSFIHSILCVIHRCLCYDFASNARNSPQSSYQLDKSPLILPTKFSKYCKFGEYDIFLKNPNTTQMLNYLFLVCSDFRLKMQILGILAAMSRVHFRYFKNKTLHKLHLEDIGYVVGNLLTGLELQDGIIIKVSGSIRKNVLGGHNKISIALGLGTIVQILFFYQPTFYLVQVSLIQMLLDHVQVFILQQILQPRNFSIPTKQKQKQKPKPRPNHKKCLSLSDLVLLIQKFMSCFAKLKDFFKCYLNSNEMFNEKINQMFIGVGEKYFKLLNINLNRNANLNQELLSQSDGDNEESRNISSFRQFDFNINQPIPQQSSHRCINSYTKYSQQEKQNESSLQQDKPILSSHINSKKYSKSMEIDNEKQQTQTNYNGNYRKQAKKQHKNAKKQTRRNNLFNNIISIIVNQQRNVQTIRILLSVFKVYCPKHVPLAQLLQPKLSNAGSDLSYTSQANNEQRQQMDIQERDTIYQKWLLSWLANFQNHFFVTAGHCRHSKQWQQQLHGQFMIQLMNDLEMSTKYALSCNEQKQSESSQMLQHCLAVIYLYVVDKVMNDCRIPSQQYLHSTKINIIVIIQWLIHCALHKFPNSQQQKQQAEQNKDELLPILDMIDSINIYNYVKSIQSTATPEQQLASINTKILLLINKLATIGDIFRHNTIFSRLVCTCLRFNRSISYMIHELTAYRNCQSQLQHFQQQQTEHILVQKLKGMLCNLDDKIHPILSYILAYLHSNWSIHNSHYKQVSVVNSEMYHLIRDQCVRIYGHKQSLFYQYIDNGYADGQGLKCMMRCLIGIANIQTTTNINIMMKGRHMHSNQHSHSRTINNSNHDHLRINNMQHSNHTPHLSLNNQQQTWLQLSNMYLSHTMAHIGQYNTTSSQLLLLCLQLCSCLVPILPYFHIHAHISRLLPLLHQHIGVGTIILSDVRLCVVSICNILSHIHIHAHNHTHVHTHQSQNPLEIEQYVSIWTSGCRILFQLLSKSFTVYPYNNYQLIKLQQHVVHCIMGSHHSYHHWDGHNKGIVGKMEQIMRQCQQGQMRDVLANGIECVVGALLQYMHNRVLQPIQPHHPQSHLKIDNLILILTLHHQLLQHIYNHSCSQLYCYRQYVQKYVANTVVRDSIKYVAEFGVSWVIRMLQSWDVNQQHCIPINNQTSTINVQINNNETNDIIIQQYPPQPNRQKVQNNEFYEIAKNNANCPSENQNNDKIQQINESQSIISKRLLQNIEKYNKNPSQHYQNAQSINIDSIRQQNINIQQNPNLQENMNKNEKGEGDVISMDIINSQSIKKPKCQNFQIYVQQIQSQPNTNKKEKQLDELKQQQNYQ